MTRKIYSIKKYVSQEGFFFPGSDIPDHVEMLEPPVELYGKIFDKPMENPEYQKTLLDVASVCIGETADRIYYSCAEGVDLDNHGTPLEELDFNAESFPLDNVLSNQLFNSISLSAVDEQLEALGYTLPVSKMEEV